CGSSSCSIAAGEHCCAGDQLSCSTVPCENADTFECDGPEDCTMGSQCCYRIQDDPSRASCRSSCGSSLTTLCHSNADCPQGLVCCPNFISPLGPTVRFCGACD